MTTTQIIVAVVMGWLIAAALLGPFIGRRIRSGHGPQKGDQK